MMKVDNTVDPLEVARFAAHAKSWWDMNGPLKTLHDINPVRVDWIRQYVSLLDLNVLDIGCGGGILSESLAKHGAKVTGLDAEAGAIQTAKAHATAEQLEIKYECAAVEAFEAPLFDAVTCLEMLEHVEDPEAIIRAAARLVKPGGYVFLSTVNRTARAYAEVIVAAEYVLSILPRQTHTFERFIRPNELARAVRHAGLHAVGITGLSYHPFTRKAALQPGEVDVNYLLVAEKPAWSA